MICATPVQGLADVVQKTAAEGLYRQQIIFFITVLNTAPFARLCHTVCAWCCRCFELI